MPAYSFPILKLETIVIKLRSRMLSNSVTGIHVEDLQSPNPQVIRHIMEIFVEEITGIGKEELNAGPQFSGIHCLEFNELHEESVPELTFFRAVVKMMCACGIDDFSYRDLIDPDPKRVKRQMSALVNFSQFRIERMAAFKEIMNHSEELISAKRKATEEQATLRVTLQELQSERTAEEPALAQLKNECCVLTDAINQLNKSQAMLRNDTSELKGHYNTCRDDVSAKHYAMLDATQELDRLTLQVTSPDIVKSDIQQTTLSLEEEKAEVVSLERRRRTTTTYFETIQRVEKDVGKITTMIHDIEETMNACKSAKTDVKTKSEDLEENHIRLTSLITMKDRVKRSLKQKQENLTDFKKESSIKIQASEEATASALSELKDAAEEQENSQGRETKVHDFLSLLEKKQLEQTAVHAKRVLEVCELSDNILKTARGYTKEMTNTMLC